ncbi:hypothetical protein MKQ68_10785 [Chitinophaga horti]|uniref:Uncharacterized protein n=1 Tax=Chitinophaga horti TaxID=2920382 RepID=A0ABY6J7D5_9BACT|nr:hypothetical protein [Chitinophaga horti]UYQ95586.1 hypothetical protein MKQ68_10785 [Chitinophaga horti]
MITFNKRYCKDRVTQENLDLTKHYLRFSASLKTLTINAIPQTSTKTNPARIFCLKINKMVVKCIANDSVLVDGWQKYNKTPLSDELYINQYYLVYGVFFFQGRVWYEILTTHDLYTKSFPSFLFEVQDSRLSRYFVLGRGIAGNGDVYPLITFKEKADDVLFYEKLVDGGLYEVEVFDKYKYLMFLEFKLPGIESFALKVQENWVQCSYCDEAWQVKCNDFEMCKCPNCNSVLLVPEF